MNAPVTTPSRLLLLALLSLTLCSVGFSRNSDLLTIASTVSPTAERMTPAEASRSSRHYLATHPGTLMVVGSGDSMNPLYPDRTVLIVKKIPFSQLRAGMTVVFMNANGWPVAHALVDKTWGGWETQGLNNDEADAGLLTDANYAGVVVKAYALSSDPMAALCAALSQQSDDTVAIN